MSAETAVLWLMIALCVIIFAAVLARLVTIALLAKSLVGRVTKLPDQLPFDPALLDASLARITRSADRATPVIARGQAAIARIRAVVAVWQRIGAQAGYTAQAATALVRELN